MQPLKVAPASLLSVVQCVMERSMPIPQDAALTCCSSGSAGTRQEQFVGYVAGIRVGSKEEVCICNMQSYSAAFWVRQASAVLTDLARNERSGMNGLALGEEVWVYASSCLGWVEELQSRGLWHCAEADDNLMFFPL